MRKIIRFAKNSTDVRTLYVNGVAIASISRLETGKYVVHAFYENIVWETSRYTDAREYALRLRLTQSTAEAEETKAANVA